MEQPNNSNGHSGNSDRDKREFSVASGVSSAIIVFLLFGSLIFLIAHDYIPDNAKRAEVLLASMFSLAIVIVVIIQAGIYSRQAKALDAQMKIAGDSLIVGNCALINVAVESNVILIRPICVYLENVGKVPAFEIDIAVELLAYSDTATKCRAVVSESIENSYGPMHLQPGNPQIFLRLRAEEYFSKEEVKAIMRHDMSLGIRGYVSWRDGFEGQPRQKTNFSFDYDVRSMVYGFDMKGETEEQWIPSHPGSWDEIAERARQYKRQNPN